MASDHEQDPVPTESLPKDSLSKSEVEDQGERSNAFPIITPGRTRQPFTEWNDTRIDFPQVCVHQLIENQAKRHPDDIAVADAKQQLTYSQLNTRANQLGQHLQKLGVGTDDLVGVAVERSAELLVALLGVLKAGGAYVPLDLEYPQERLEFMAKDSGLRVVLTQEAFRTRLPKVIGQQVYIDSSWGLISRERGEDFCSGAEPNNLVYVIYTSGSTGQPKGVQISHRSLVNLLESLRIKPGFTAQDIFLATNTFSFDMSKPELFLPLVAGGRVFVANRGIANDLERFEACLVKSRATVLQGPPSFWRLLVESGWQGSTRLKIFCGGEAWPGGLAKELLKRSSSVWNLYGPTETTVWSTVFQVVSGNSPLLLGAPIANTQLYILDDGLQAVPVGLAGELHIGGDGLARGYLNRSELTAEKFIANPFSQQQGARLYKTGDLARYLPDGNIEFVGRVDHQVKIRGFRIELGEIESVLAEHPAIQAAAVIMREDVIDDLRLVAYVVPRTFYPPAPEELRTLLKRRLPEYMMPSRFEFLDALPLTPNGKVDRGALPARGTLGSPRPQWDIAPRTELEEKLVRIFAGVLGHNRIGIQEDFFESGGDSLLALKLMAKVEKELKRKISFTTLFEAPSVSQLADLLSDQRPCKGVPGVLPIKPIGSRPPFFCIGAGPFLRPLALRLGSDQPFLGLDLEEEELHNLPVPFRLEDISAILVKKLLAAQPEGPYYFGGRCAHGLIAFEMAQQIQAEGNEVRLVVLLDAGNPARIPKYFQETEENAFWARLSWLARRIRFFLFNLRQMGLTREFTKYVFDGLNGKLTLMKSRLRWITYQLNLWRGVNIRDQRLDLIQIEYLAVPIYRPQPYSGSVALIRCPLAPKELVQDDDIGWSEVVSREKLEIHFASAADDEMFVEPHVGLTAVILKSVLMAAQEAGKEKDLAATVKN